MEQIQLKEAVSLIGFQVKTFPNAIGEAFDLLMQKFPDGLQRSYYGISRCENNSIVYWAMAEEKQKDEAEKYQLTRSMLAEGDYHSVSIHAWRSKTDSIKDVFHNMMEELHTEPGVDCIEWYKTDEEMFCMIKQ